MLVYQDGDMMPGGAVSGPPTQLPFFDKFDKIYIVRKSSEQPPHKRDGIEDLSMG